MEEDYFVYVPEDERILIERELRKDRRIMRVNMITIGVCAILAISLIIFCFAKHGYLSSLN